MQKTFFDALALAIQDSKKVGDAKGEEELGKVKEKVDTMLKAYSECVGKLKEYQDDILEKVIEIEQKCKK